MFNSRGFRHISGTSLERKTLARVFILTLLASTWNRDVIAHERENFRLVDSKCKRLWTLRARSSGLTGVLYTQHRHGHFDAVFVQETLVVEAAIGDVTREHANLWGYRTGPGCPRLSYWSAAQGTRAGDENLFHQRGLFTGATPIYKNYGTHTPWRCRHSMEQMTSF